MLYVLGISVVAGILFVAVNEFEPDRRLALTLKFLHPRCECCSNRRKTDELTASWAVVPAGRCVAGVAGAVVISPQTVG